MLNNKREDFKKSNCPGYDTKPDVILAENTVEMLRLVEMAELVMKEKYSGDPRRWMDAIFYVLVIKNSAYLWQEQHKQSEDVELCHKLQENLSKAYSRLEADKQGGDVFESSSYSSFMLTSSALIKVFSKFSNILVKEGASLDLTDSLQDLKNIEKNVIKCISKYDCDSSTWRKTVDTNEAKSNRCYSNDSSSSLSSVSSASPSVLCTVADTGGCATTSVTASAIFPRESSSSDIKCEGCSEKIVIFNNDVEFSRDLHAQEKVHKQAITAKRAEIDFKVNENLASLAKKLQQKLPVSDSLKPTRSLSEGDKGDGSIENEKLLTPELESFIRSTLNNQLGLHSSCIRILSPREFSCILCDCPISCLQNLEMHVSGKAHTKLWENGNQKFVGSKPKEEDPAVAKKKDAAILQISDSAIPVKNLIIK